MDAFIEGLDRWRVDGRFALRSIRARPAATMVAALTLAVGVATSTAMFTVVRGVILRPLPVQGQDRIVLVSRHPAADTVT
jgi:hypothetical protein